MLNELYTFAEPVQVVPFSSLKWGKFTLLHTMGDNVLRKVYSVFLKKTMKINYACN